MTTATLNRYKVSLEGFHFTGHEGPDGELHLSPVHREGYHTTAKPSREYVVEAHDELHAESVFARTMGIVKTTRDYAVEPVTTDKGKRKGR